MENVPVRINLVEMVGAKQIRLEALEARINELEATVNEKNEAIEELVERISSMREELDAAEGNHPPQQPEEK